MPRTGRGFLVSLYPTDSLLPKPSRPFIRPSSEGGNDDDTATISGPKSSSVALRQSFVQAQTTFHFPYSVTTPSRLKLTPQLLLQLHESDQMSRPIPKYDVFTAAIALRLVSRFRKFPGSCRNLGPSDLIIVMNDMYEKHHLGKTGRVVSQEDCLPSIKRLLRRYTSNRQICYSAPDVDQNVEIVSSRGQSWEGNQLPNGAYEFIYKGDNQECKLRWVARGRAAHPASDTSVVGNNHIDEPKRLICSAIGSKFGRPPVIASVTRKEINIFHRDSRTIVQSTSEQVSLPTLDTPELHELIEMEEELHLLIVTSDVWIAFMEGWAMHFPGGDVSNSSLLPRSNSREVQVVEMMRKNRQGGFFRRPRKGEAFRFLPPGR